MLTGDRAKYLCILFGIAFATLLMAQQMSIFVGVLLRTTSQIRDVRDAQLWVMDAELEHVDDIRPLPDSALERVRGVEGVAWTAPFSKGIVQARLGDGGFRQAILLGIDDATLVGAPETMVVGNLADLRHPDAVIIDEAGYDLIWPGESRQAGKLLEIGERRAVLVGVCKASAPFQTFPVLYTRYSLAKQFALPQRHHLSFVLGAVQPGADPRAVCRRIQEQTGMQALTGEDFAWKTIDYYCRETGLVVNFAITVGLGFIVGLAIAGQTLYLFTVENLRQFGALKAMGVTDRQLIGMVLLQALVVGVLGYALGVGLTVAFIEVTEPLPELRGLFLPWQVLVATAAAVFLIVILASLLSIRRVWVVEPAIVFRG
jgi:putative ABC transport system permease protein